MARLTLIPGFRFNPSDEILVVYYLKRKILGMKIASNVVAEVNIYDFCPWDLPGKSALKSGDLEWYFFCPKSKKYSSGGRANRATETGFWKATGKDRMVEYRGRTVATIKTLVFHLGRAKDGKRTNWVLHEYRMNDEQLANAGVVQDTYVLCRLFEKSGAGPQNGAQYGAPFNEDEWNDDLVNSIDSQAIVGLVGASITTDHEQKGPAMTDMTGPGSSIVTISETEPTSTLNYKQKGLATTNVIEPGSSSVTISVTEPVNMLNYKQQGPATTSMTEPGSTCVTLSANELTNTLIYKQKGQAKRDMTEPGSSVVTFPANKRYKPTSTLNDKQKGPATTKMAKPGSSAVMFSANKPTNTLSSKQEGPATMDMIVPQTTHGLSVTEPGSSSVMNKMPADIDMMLSEEVVDQMPREPEEKVKTMTPNEDDGIFDGLGNIVVDFRSDSLTVDDYNIDDIFTVDDLNTDILTVDDLNTDILTVDDLNTDGSKNTIDECQNLDGLDLEDFFVD